ncbi:hypothetical protein GCM10027157_11360 [Corynebacterium aquatimens]
MLSAVDATHIDAAVDTAPGRVSVRSYIDSNEELSDVVSSVRGILKESPNARIAIAACDSTYLPALKKILDSAGIPNDASAPVGWNEDPYIQSVLYALSLDPNVLPRRALSDLLGIVLLDGAPSLYNFDRLSRGGTATLHDLSDWRKLDAEVLSNEDKRIQKWVFSLADGLHRVRESETWKDTAAALDTLIKSVVKEQFASKDNDADAQGSGARTNDERALAVGVLRNSIETLAELDGVLPPPTPEVVVDMLSDTLPARQTDAKRDGVAVGDLVSMVGLQLDYLFIVGANDIHLPGTFVADAAIKPEQSDLDSEWFTTHIRRLWEGALNAAHKVRVSFPRSSISGAISGEPSSWLVPLVGSSKKDWERIRFRSEELVPPTDAAMAIFDESVSTEETGATRLRQFRKAGTHNEFNGYVDTPAGKEWLDQAVSSSSLEEFSAAPQKFFITRILGRALLDDKGQTADLDASGRGTLYHAIFEEWSNRYRIGPDAPTKLDKEQAEPALAEVVDKHVLPTLAQLPPLTADVVRRDFARFTTDWLKQELKDATGDWVAVGAEAEFGQGRSGNETPPFPIVLDDGSIIYVKGSIDRVDVKRTGDTFEVRVTDYKSGKGKTYVDKLGATKKPKDLDLDDPQRFIGKPLDYESGTGGYALQLAIYGEVVHGVLEAIARGDDPEESPAPTLHRALVEQGIDGSQPVTVKARYWMFTDPDDSVVEITVGDAARNALKDYLRTTRESILRGEFPPTHAKKNYADAFTTAFGPNRNLAISRAVAAWTRDEES